MVNSENPTNIHVNTKNLDMSEFAAHVKNYHYQDKQLQFPNNIDSIAKHSNVNHFFFIRPDNWIDSDNTHRMRIE